MTTTYSNAIGATPELTSKDLGQLQESTKRALALMRGGEWHSATAIIHASGIREGLRRLRELRQRGCTIERRVLSGREFEYRMTGGAQG